MNIIKHDFNGKDIRVILIDNKPYFVVKDIVEILDIKNSSKAISDLKFRLAKANISDKGITVSYPLETNGGIQDLTLVSEVGLYELIFASKKIEAIRFRYWISEDVPPSIRKTGSYSIQLTKKSIKEETENLAFAFEQYDIFEKSFKKFGNLSKKKLAEKTSKIVAVKTGIDFLEIFGGFQEVKHSFQNSFSLTSLLEKYDIQILTYKFNLKLEKLGIIERCGENWKILNLDFGINEYYKDESNPRYFEDSFEELLKLVFPLN